MRMHYDQTANSAFLQLSDQAVNRERSRTVALDPWVVDGLVNLYFDDQGRIVGVEFCEASELLPPETLPPDALTTPETEATS